MEMTFTRPRVDFRIPIVFLTILLVSVGILHAIQKHGQSQVDSALQCRNRPDFILKSLSGNKLVMCKLDNNRWGAEIENESGETKTAFVNNLKSILKWARNQGYNKVEYSNSNLIDEITNVLSQMR